MGCPGGAIGRRIELMIDFWRRRFFEREDFIANAGGILRDAIPALKKCQRDFLTSKGEGERSYGYARFRRA